MVNGMPGFFAVPMALATGKPLAIVVIFGLITATALTLFVLPAISHLLLHGRSKRHIAGDYTDVTPWGTALPAE